MPRRLGRSPQRPRPRRALRRPARTSITAATAVQSPASIAVLAIRQMSSFGSRATPDRERRLPRGSRHARADISRDGLVVPRADAPRRACNRPTHAVDRRDAGPTARRDADARLRHARLPRNSHPTDAAAPLRDAPKIALEAVGTGDARSSVALEVVSSPRSGRGGCLRLCVPRYDVPSVRGPLAGPTALDLLHTGHDRDDDDTDRPRGERLLADSADAGASLHHGVFPHIIGQ